MTLRHCDICGAVHDAEDLDVGRGQLVVLKRAPDTNPFAGMFGRPEQEHDRYDFCAQCVRHLVMLLAELRVTK